MIKLENYSLDAKKLKEVEFDDSILSLDINSQTVKDYIVAIRNNQRQWSANTKGRSEVNHSNAKPHRQKGTGKARQGSLSSPQYKGGGIVFGPKPKFDQNVRINKKEKRAVIRFLISQKIKDNKLSIVSSIVMKEPKTKTVNEFLKARSLDKRTLFLCEDEKTKVGEEKSQDNQNFKKSVRNIPKTKYSHVTNVNGYQLIVAEHVVITEAGLKQFLEQNK